MAGTIIVSTDISDVLSNTSRITSEWFGAIYTGFHDFSGFQIGDVSIGISSIRWPGGHLSETRHNVYGLDIPGLFDPTDLYINNPNRQRPDLAQSLAYAVSNEDSFSIIIPTARYSDDLETGEQHLIDFLHDLFTGVYGELPENLILELGNEYAAQQEFTDDPSAYALVASRFAEIIEQAVIDHAANGPITNITIAAQMGITEEDNIAILNGFSSDGLRAVDTLIFHALPISMQNLGSLDDNLTIYERVASRYEAWADSIRSVGGSSDPGLYMSAWTVGGSSNNADGVDLQWHDYGLRGASVLLEIFSGFSSIGVDAAAVWGVDVSNLNSLTYVVNGEILISHVGVLFEMMSRNLPGLSYVGDFVPGTRTEDILQYTFTNGETISQYTAINELNNNNNVVEIIIEGSHNFQVMSATLLGTEIIDGFQGTINDVESRIHESPTITTLTDFFSESGMSVEFLQSYQVVEFVLDLGIGLIGSPGEDWILGYLTGDVIEGLAGNDFIQGLAGSDTISGGRGDDELYGGDGNDYLYGNGGDDQIYGGEGDDVLSGGSGFDILIGGQGADRFHFASSSNGGMILDFEPNIDQIDLSGIFQAFGQIQFSQSSFYANFQRAGTLSLTETLTIEVSENDLGIYLNATESHGQQIFSLLIEGISSTQLGGPEYSLLMDQTDFLYVGDFMTLLGSWGNVTLNDILFLDARQDANAINIEQYIGENISGAQVITGTSNPDIIRGDDAGNIFAGLDGNDQIIGVSGNDVIMGGSGSDYLVGNAGEDLLIGDVGDDFLRGGAGRDLLFGGPGSDYILGFDGNDVLVGGQGADYLAGEGGTDLFVFNSGDAPELDTIGDFEVGVDKILIYGASFTDLTISSGFHGCEVQYVGGVIQILDVDMTLVTESDFLFH